MLRSRGRGRGGSGGAAAFNYASISGNVLWLDSSYAASISEVGGDVSTWGDRSGNSNDFVQATGANKPNINATTLNGKKVITFGTGKFMTASGSGLFNISNGNNTLFVVFRQSNTSGSAMLLDGKQQSFSNWVWGMRCVSNGTVLSGMSGSFGQESNKTVVAGTNGRLAVFRRTGTGAGNTLTYEAGSPGTTGTGTSNTLDAIFMGKNLSGGFDYLTGDMALVLAWSRNLTNAEMNTVGTAIQAEWGIPWTTI